MDRFGIFVDAGYLFAASGELCFKTTDRNKLVVDFGSITTALSARAAADCGLRHLRTYWYDGARDAHPTAQHVEVAHLPGVKLRLGRLVKNRQKGVDSRIVRDLIVLSQERAISIAYLLGGDEDLREGVSEAQERGVRVVLMAVEPLNEQNLSPTLVMEADEIILLNHAFISPHVHLRDQVTTVEHVAGTETEPLSMGRGFGVDWLARTSHEEIAEVRRNRPRISAELDRALLSAAATALGRRHLDDDVRHEIRRGFWQAILGEIPGGPTP